MYNLISCIKSDLKKVVEQANREDLRIVSLTEFNEDWYDVIVEEKDRVMY